jgi:hypothetical protein
MGTSKNKEGKKNHVEHVHMVMQQTVTIPETITNSPCFVGGEETTWL